MTNDGQIYAEVDDAVWALTPMLPSENIVLTCNGWSDVPNRIRLEH